MIHEPFDAIPDDDTLVERFEPALVAVAAELGSLALFCHAQGWARASSASFSARASSVLALITAAGRDKGALTTADFLLVDVDGKLERSGPAPSEDAPLHCALYRKRPDVGAVAHAHSIAATVLSRHFARRGAVTLRGYAMARALGAPSPDAALVLPVVKNSFDDEAVARAVESRVDPGAVGLLIEGRGLTTWGADVAALRSRLEAIEFLLACELAALSLPAEGLAPRGPPRPASPLARSPRRPPAAPFAAATRAGGSSEPRRWRFGRKTKPASPFRGNREDVTRFAVSSERRNGGPGPGARPGPAPTPAQRTMGRARPRSTSFWLPER